MPYFVTYQRATVANNNGNITPFMPSLENEVTRKHPVEWLIEKKASMVDSVFGEGVFHRYFITLVFAMEISEETAKKYEERF
jgi:hypothetical protein